jgi:hypothetical protein
MVGRQCTEGCSAGLDKICVAEKHLSSNRSRRRQVDERLAQNFDCTGIQPICYSLDKVIARPTHTPTRSNHMAVLTERALLGKIRLSDSICWFIPRLPLGRAMEIKGGTQMQFFCWSPLHLHLPDPFPSKEPLLRGSLRSKISMAFLVEGF